MTQDADGTIKLLRVIYTAVAAGVLVFLGIVIMLRGELRQPDLAERAPLLLAVLGLLVVGCVVGHSVLERAVLAGLARARVEDPQAEHVNHGVVAAYRQMAIVVAGLIDGPSFLAGAIYLLTGSSVALGAAGVGVALLLSRMPSRERLERFAARSREQQ